MSATESAGAVRSEELEEPASRLPTRPYPSVVMRIAVLRLAAVWAAVFGVELADAPTLGAYPLAVTLAALWATAFAIASAKGRRVPVRVQGVLDLISLGLMLYTSGGAESPVRSLFLLAPVAGAITFDARRTVIAGLATIVAFSAASGLYAVVEDGSGRQIPAFGVYILLAAIGAALPLRAVARVAREGQRAAQALKGVAELGPDALLFVDRDGLVTFANVQAQTLFRASLEEMTGRPARELLGVGPRPEDMQDTLRLRARRLDGSVFPYESSLTLIETEAGPATVIAVRDATTQAEAEHQRRRLLASALAAEERERGRIAARLHEDVLQSLLSARQDLEEAEAGDSEALRYGQQALREGVDELRRTVTDLRPAALDHGSLRAAIEALCRRHAERRELTWNVTIADDPPKSLEAAIFALARELVGNSVLHGSPAHVDVAVSVQGTAVRIVVSDDGSGMSSERRMEAEREGRVGLASISERMAAVGGGLSIDSSADGTTVHVRVPLAIAEETEVDDSADASP